MVLMWWVLLSATDGLEREGLGLGEQAVQFVVSDDAFLVEDVQLVLVQDLLGDLLEDPVADPLGVDQGLDGFSSSRFTLTRRSRLTSVNFWPLTSMGGSNFQNLLPFSSTSPLASTWTLTSSRNLFLRVTISVSWNFRARNCRVFSQGAAWSREMGRSMRGLLVAAR
jgi:hypothetical protein